MLMVFAVVPEQKNSSACRHARISPSVFEVHAAGVAEQLESTQLPIR
jgi:hypothetical protein